ncbi:DNA recombination protein RecT [Cohnella xylanilytica]|uniref:recombination protein RecT n=1 Tax=Cohnella xylanilytica TaxID=557555 RepID=UPI001B068EDC|nr:recombination protein RecT [Cohnella xylanilytica]GIO13568.1 DNA recombination protein RecT [Cohnella xylanilytica]
MAASNTSRSTGQLADKLQTQAAAGGNAPAASPAQTIGAYMEKMKSQIAEAMPKHMSIDRLSRIALTTIRTNPKLLECTVPSLMGAVMQAAQLGLEPGLLGQCYFVPFKDNKKGISEVQFIIGYKGMIDLARRSGNILSITAHIVYMNDYLELEYGLEDKLRHVPWHIRTDEPKGEPGEVRGAYMVAKFKDGGHYVLYMPLSEILKHRDRSSGYQNAVKYGKTNNPWFTDPEEMYKKTVTRAGWKWLPISVEMASAVTRDESVPSDVAAAAGDFIDISGSSVDDEQDSGGVPSEVEEFERAMDAG